MSAPEPRCPSCGVDMDADELETDGLCHECLMRESEWQRMRADDAYDSEPCADEEDPACWPEGTWSR